MGKLRARRGPVQLTHRESPMRLLDYVVAHEITHLLHDDHCTAF
ncbi:M48 family metallopeptidase [Corallococcus macrosporus]|uniref:M48 family metallopeptidase n=1 Tax=Corallococcus macrosporus TaxID=35 RepID=A0ABS3D5V7_9BACT|nr:M48 family metallopeptidase [Corallococcus macrosporus]